ncbi:MAG TPA: CbiX/SirB N-terminal domain-containing protein, partial [Methanoregulaceae archaeon]|nr:CbiX/SirB N-terminal domain-containing protein [Methanoregulaceae archaeon]
MSKKGILLVGHGSKLPYNKELVEETAGLIARRYPDFIVKCGFMNMNSPSIKDSMDAFRNEPIEVLVVVPLFWLAALPGLSGATLRIFYSFVVPLFGGRLWTAISTASLLLPAFGVG